MNFFKNLFLFGAMFAGGIVALNYAGLVDVNLPVSGGTKTVIEAELPTTGTTVSTTYEGTATIANLQNIPEPTCKENEISTIENGQVVCKIPEVAKNLDCISPFGLTIKEGGIIKLAKPELKKCSEEEFKCTDGKFLYHGNKTTNIPSYEEYKYDVKECRPLVVNGIPCDAPRGLNEKFEDGQLFIAYEKTIVSKDEDCKFEKVACLGGALKQKYGYKEKTCSHATNFSLSYIKQNQDKLVEQNTDGTISISTMMTDDTSNAAKKSCDRFGRVVPNSENIYAFKDQTVPFQEDCEFEVKVCRDGEFTTPNKGYEFKECFIAEGLDCKIDKTNLGHSNAATYYAKYDPKLKDCASQVRRCWNGTADGDSEYIYTTCNKPVGVTTSNLNRCPNPFVGESKAWSHGEKGVGYFKNTVGWFGNCEGEVDGRINKVAVECLYGSIQSIGNNVKIWRSCSKGTPKDCTTPWGSKVEHGKSVVAYENGSLTYGSSCESEVRVCNDGVLGGRYQYQSCSIAQPVGCMTPWGESVAHKGSFTAFQTDSVSYGNICASQTRVCTNGVNNGSYVFRSCVVNAPVGCVYEGVSLAHGQTVTRATTPKIVGDPLEGKSECSWFSAKCNNGTMQGNLLNNPDARFTSCNAGSLNN